LASSRFGKSNMSTPSLNDADTLSDRAITSGQELANNALAEPATMALRYAWLAERKSRDRRLQDVVRLLEEGIRLARYGGSEDGVQAVKADYKLR
jgi:hypothetical protein